MKTERVFFGDLIEITSIDYGKPSLFSIPKYSYKKVETTIFYKKNDCEYKDLRTNAIYLSEQKAMNIGDKLVYTKTLVPYTVKCIFNGIGVNERVSKRKVLTNAKKLSRDNK